MDSFARLIEQLWLTQLSYGLATPLDLNKVHPHDCIFIPLHLGLEYTSLQN